MLSIRDIVQSINDRLSLVFTTGFISYGVAYTAIRKNNDGTQDQLPSINEKYIGIDDVHAMQLYHKINGITMSQRQGSGYGDDISYNVNTYSMSMIVFNNQKRTKLNPDELALLIQSAFPKIIKSENFISVQNLITSVILNSQQVYSQEYKSDTFRLDEYQSLFQINYNMEIVFKTDCFALCPEDFLKIKN